MSGEQARILRGDVREVAASLAAESFDGCLCDPPYGLSFMGKKWDYDVPSVETWAAVLGALKPGAHLLAFAGTRTQHRMAVRIEDAGFEIRDMIAWVYGSGFPKSLDVSKAIDKAAGEEREIVGRKLYAGPAGNDANFGVGNRTVSSTKRLVTAPATDAARLWSGYGTALKPALEPITVARKPIVGTVAANCQKFGTGALNVDGCRVPGEEDGSRNRPPSALGSETSYAQDRWTRSAIVQRNDTTGLGRWPANLIHDGSGEVLAGFPQSKDGVAVNRNRSGEKPNSIYGKFAESKSEDQGYGGGGSAARFFYCAKASRSEREAGLREAGLREVAASERTNRAEGSAGLVMAGGKANPYAGNTGDKEPSCNHHPTVKPISLAEYLARLILPPKRDTPRRLLVPFSGSGSEIIGALRAGWDEVVGIELSTEYAEIAEARIANWNIDWQREMEFEAES